MTQGASLRSKWADGVPTFGPFVQLPAPGIVEILAHAGFGLVNIDLEHGAINLETAENMIRAADAQGIVPMVRVLANRPELISAALNLGATGVLVPHVDSIDAAEAAVAACRFGPIGSRGVCPFVRAASYSALKSAEYYERANRDVIAVVMVEGTRGLESLEGILSVAGLDAVFVGPYDLSQSLGVTGQPSHPIVVEKVAEVCKKAAAFGKVVGLFVETPESAVEWVRRGVLYLGFDVDAQIVYRASRQIVSAMLEGLQTIPVPISMDKEGARER